MKIYSALQIGEYHINHCEDYLFIGEIGNEKIICAVMDGCTMGKDSHFSSTLVGKILRKIVKEKSYKEFYNFEKYTSIDNYLKSIVHALFNELKEISNQLLLDKLELLTTLVLLIVDKKSEQGIVLVIGDGFISINGDKTEFDQNNKPDYLGLHLSSDFEAWYNSQKQKVIFESIKDLSIATDGILTFSQLREVHQKEDIDAIDFLLTDTTYCEKEDMLDLKLKKLEHTFGLKATDDLAIIRLIQ
jgi:hypothetical protein